MFYGSTFSMLRLSQAYSNFNISCRKVLNSFSGKATFVKMNVNILLNKFNFIYRFIDGRYTFSISLNHRKDITTMIEKEIDYEK